MVSSGYEIDPPLAQRFFRCAGSTAATSSSAPALWWFATSFDAWEMSAHQQRAEAVDRAPGSVAGRVTQALRL
jgi:hypothetical protein